MTVRPLTGLDLRRIIDTLQPWDGRRILEVFAGFAVLTRAALQNGAQSSLLIEKDLQTARALRKTWNNDVRIRIWQMDFRPALKRLSGKERFDLIFVDPPFGSNLVSPALEMIQMLELISASGIILVKSSPKEWVDLLIPWHLVLDHKKNDIRIGAWMR